MSPNNHAPIPPDAPPAPITWPLAAFVVARVVVVACLLVYLIWRAKVITPGFPSR